MALSASESELLTQTCENMNIAANTCREVLEMLRNLGNTGVVDIATHNNTPGAHANDGTLVHASVFDTNGKSISIGDADGMPYAPLVVNMSSKNNAVGVRSYTNGRDGVVFTGCSVVVERYLSDASCNRLSFNNPGTTGQMVLHYITAKLVDADNKSIYAGFHFYAGTLNHPIEENNTPAYGCIRPTLSYGTASTFSQPFEFNSEGITPPNNNTVSLGVNGRAWKDAFLVNSPTITSDRRAKKDVSALGSQAVEFIKALRPVSYRLKQGEGHLDLFNEDGEAVPNDTPDREGIRTHWGLIAQEVKEAMASAGYEDAALWCLADKDDPDSQQSLRYTELIAPMIKVIQQQQERIEALERKVG